MTRFPIMNGFDTSTMTYLAPTISHPLAPNRSGFPAGLVPNDMQDHFSSYDANTYAGSEHVSLHPLQHTIGQVSPLAHPYPTNKYDEPFSDVVSAFDGQLPTEPQNADTPSIERDHKLLSFSQPPNYEHVLLDLNYRQTTIALGAQLHGMFFLAESPWPTEENAAPPPSELTCYRRNLFQITGNITLPRLLRYVLNEAGQQIPILNQELCVSATESTEDNAVRLISVPWKTPINAGQAGGDDKAEREPTSIPLDFMNAQDLDSDFAGFPFQWKRLQFRIATANNGRRKELQQHFVVRIKVMATLATGHKVSICEIVSGAIIVRGRSPRNFQSRKDMPLNGAGSHARKSSQMPPQISRTSTGESSLKLQTQTPSLSAAAVKTDIAQPALSIASFFDPNDLQPSPHLFASFPFDPMNHGAMTALPQEAAPFTFNDGYAASSPDLLRKPTISKAKPINLSLVEDDTPKATPGKRRDTSTTPVRPPFAPPPRPPSFNLNTISSPDEAADGLYEYFPLALDDWMPPVDAVYRPHVVHHINVSADPRDPGAPVGKGRSKRYFSDVVE